MAKPSAEVPGLTIGFWRTGLYTHRSQLFAPIRTMGINVVQMRDALIDGQDMEVTDLLEIQRRPGFSRFCSQQLAGGEIANQFYSFRAAGTVFPLMDTNQRFTVFSTSAITTIWTKPSADQAFPFMVGTQLYICNGTADGQKRYDTGTSALHKMGIPGPAAMPTVAAPTAVNATFWQPNIAYLFNGTHGAILIDSNGNVQEARINAAASGTAPPTWATQFGSGTADNAQVWLNLGPPHSWQPSTTAAVMVGIIGAVIVDSNGNIQQCTSNGTSGAAAPAWSTVIGNNTVDGTINWTCMSNRGPASVFSGYIYVYTYSTQAPTVTTGYYHCSTASPQTYSTGPVFGTYSETIGGAFSTNTDVGSVDIYRIKDGGSILNYVGSVANNTGGGNWTFTDSTLDVNLNTSVTVPPQGFRRNDVPPGQTGSLAPSTDKLSFLTFWNGRLWGIAGNKVYFDAGADCQNGDPRASWPPANVFVFPSNPIALTGTSVGLLVWLSDQVKIIAGGPQTTTFFAADLMENFGISSPNCISKDGDTIRLISTQGQQFTLTVSEKIEDGNFVADLIASNFAPATSYLTTHRNGLDSGVFISNGESLMLRYGLNIGSWSPIYKPVGGIKALRSIETSVGKYTLIAGRASAAGFILGRDLTTHQDDGQNYSDCFATVGNIVLSEPRQPLVDLRYVILYLAATGSLPTVSILPNEISGTSGVGFVTIPGIQNEPTTGATASTTLLSKQWEIRSQQSMKTSTLMHHVQVKIDFPPENAANTIKVLSLKFGEDP